MLSSTSNIKNNSWLRSWILGLLIAVVCLSGLEYFWRIKGHEPAIVDDQRLWAVERNKIGKTSSREIALLGSSRMQTDISMITLRDLIPDYKVINLSITGTCANAVLHDLAMDTRFAGTVIMETTSECLMFGYDQNLSQQSYVDYFHKSFNLNAKLNRHIATWIQQNLDIVDPYLNPIKVLSNFVINGAWRTPNYMTTYEDRSRLADYDKMEIARHKNDRLRVVDTHFRELLPNISTVLLAKQLADIDKDVRKILDRGGNVIFVQFPVSDEHWAIDEKYFPRDKYWDKIAPVTRARVLHFKDMDVVKNLACPDSSHLDRRDTKIFTLQLFSELIGKK